jgi:hypothetical protein
MNHTRTAIKAFMAATTKRLIIFCFNYSASAYSQNQNFLMIKNLRSSVFTKDTPQVV